jgi:hypothetical protein
LIIDKNALEKQSKLNKDKISELSLERNKVLNELDYLQNYRFNFLVNWKKIYLDSTFAYFELEFEINNYKIKCNIIPLFDKIKMTQQIIYVINEIENIN